MQMSKTQNSWIKDILKSNSICLLVTKYEGPKKFQLHHFLNPFSQLAAVKDSKNGAATKFFGHPYFDLALIISAISKSLWPHCTIRNHVTNHLKRAELGDKIIHFPLSFA